jgi:hypothetical protein
LGVNAEETLAGLPKKKILGLAARQAEQVIMNSLLNS